MIHINLPPIEKVMKKRFIISEKCGQTNHHLKADSPLLASPRQRQNGTYSFLVSSRNSWLAIIIANADDAAAKLLVRAILRLARVAH